MEEYEKEIVPWMKELAIKNGVSVNTVYHFYSTIDSKQGKTPRKRTEEFFNSYGKAIRNNERNTNG